VWQQRKASHSRTSPIERSILSSRRSTCRALDSITGLSGSPLDSLESPSSRVRSWTESESVPAIPMDAMTIASPSPSSRGYEGQ
jgi:hypothetical protein